MGRTDTGQAASRVVTSFILKLWSERREDFQEQEGGKELGVLEDGLPSNGVPRSTVPGGISNPEKKTNCETQCPNPQSLSSGPLTQKQNGLQTTEAKRDAKRMSAKEVTINVTDSIQQMDRSRRITKNCVN
nr:brain and acute leukemia cytoplasmic protein isoform X2 [Pongo pygmaeus]